MSCSLSRSMPRFERGNLVCFSFIAAWLLWKVWDITCLGTYHTTLTLQILKTFPQIKYVYLSQNHTSIASFSLDMSIHGWKLSCCFIFTKCYQVRYLHEVCSNSSQSILNHGRLVKVIFNILIQLHSSKISVLNRSRIELSAMRVIKLIFGACLPFIETRCCKKEVH